jgi:hypothetical protein
MLLAHAADSTAASPVYTVAVLRAYLARQPEAWLDRPLRVRAIAHRPLRVRQVADACSAWTGPERTSPCMKLQPEITDPSTATGTAALPLAPGPVPSLVAVLRRLPLIGTIAPLPQEPHWDALAVYRIELHALWCGPAQPPCAYEALLLDAAR